MKIQSSFLLLFTCGVLMVSSLKVGAYSGGDGTSQSPYQIANKADLKQLSETSSTDWDKFFVQTEDIVFTTADFEIGGDFYNDGEGFGPIGNSSLPFMGSYDGQNHTIEGVYINKSADNNVATGFFGIVGKLNDNSIKNLGLINVNITGYRLVGALCGLSYASLISNCYSTGTVKGVEHIGGLFGVVSSKVSDCYSSANCYGTSTTELNSYIIGGFCGSAGSGTISNCYSTGNVQGVNWVGGFCGTPSNVVVKCYATGDVSGIENVGGFCGMSSSSPSTLITQSFSTGNVVGENYVGGFCGYNANTLTNNYSTGSVTRNGIDAYGYTGGFCGYHAGTINKCYSTGQMNYSVDGYINAFIGSNQGVINNSFWNTETANSYDDNVKGLRTEKMKTRNTFILAGWDFTNETLNGTQDIWKMGECTNNGYPVLSWQTITKKSVAMNVTLSGNTLTVDAGVATYQWLDCENNKAVISGATNNSYTAMGGHYAVVVTQGTCVDTSACMSMTTTGVLNAVNATTVKVYPNPSNGVVNVDLQKDSKVIIMDMMGRTVSVSELSQGDHIIDMSSASKGVYFIKIENDKEQVASKLVIE